MYFIYELMFKFCVLMTLYYLIKLQYINYKKLNKNIKEVKSELNLKKLFKSNKK